MEKGKKKGWLKWQAASLLTAALVCVLAGVAAPVRGKAAAVTVEGGNMVLTVSSTDRLSDVEQAFNKNGNITIVCFDDSVTEIPDDILYNKSSVTTVEFQGEVTSVGYNAFYECSALKEIDLSSAETIGDSAFNGCSALEKIDLRSAETIGSEAFTNCRNLSTVTLSEGLISIGDFAFYVTALTEIKLPSTVRSIGANAFNSCEMLSTVTLSEGLISIGDSAFYATALTEIEIPSSVKTIGQKAFLYTGLTEFRYPVRLTISNIDLPSGAVTISYTIDGTGAKTYTCDNNKHIIKDKGNGVLGCSRCDYTSLKITRQPSDVTVEEGNEASFSVAAAGEGALSYQWQVSGDNGNTWLEIAGEKGETYAFSSAQTDWNGRQYRCAVANTAGTVYSSAAVLTVTARQEPPSPEETEETPDTPAPPVPEETEDTPAAPEPSVPAETIETPETQPAVTAEEEQSARESLNQQVQAGKTYNRLRWARVKGADGYIIYGSKCSSGDKKHKMKELKTIASGRKTSWTHKGLKKNTWYKYQIAAYKLVNGKQVEIGSSVSLHSLTQGDGRYANPSRVKVSKTKITLKKGRSTVVKAEAVLPKGKKTEHHTEEIRYVVSDPAIVSVTKKGKIKGKKKGSCTVYAVAQNGVYEKIKVKVK